MERTPARLAYWASLKGKPHGHKTSNGKHWKMSEERKGRMRAIALADGRKPDFTGHKHSEVSKDKMRQATLRKPTRHWLGKDRSEVFTKEYRLKMSKAMAKLVAEGTHNFWKGGLTQSNKIERSRVEYKIWREHVFNRDNFTCQACGERGGRLEAHHDLSFAHYPYLRFEVLNGVTLCHECHKKTDNYGRKSLSPTDSITALLVLLNKVQ